ncbi:MAG: hypothetical protein HRT45_10785 [Bdellovibrionales bacterium]|nr:hypothetical protein [Bdellovibrionales bacterium]
MTTSVHDFNHLIQRLKLIEREAKTEFEFELPLLVDPGYTNFGWVHADALRLDDFLKFIETEAHTESDLEAVFSLIIFSLNLYIKGHGNAKQFWNRIFEVYLSHEALLQKHVESFGSLGSIGGFLAYSVLTTDFEEYKLKRHANTK